MFLDILSNEHFSEKRNSRIELEKESFEPEVCPNKGIIRIRHRGGTVPIHKNCFT